MLYENTFFRKVIFPAESPETVPPFPCPVVEILIVLFVAVFIHLVAADVGLITLEVRPGDQGQIVLVRELNEPFETSVFADVDFNVLGSVRWVQSASTPRSA